MQSCLRIFPARESYTRSETVRRYLAGGHPRLALTKWAQGGRTSLHGGTPWAAAPASSTVEDTLHMTWCARALRECDVKGFTTSFSLETLCEALATGVISRAYVIEGGSALLSTLKAYHNPFRHCSTISCLY